MSQNYDDIQAQLAAYIDGALPPEQQAEIEKHLAANPSHQALLGELTVHKRIIAKLPRVKAPTDLTEELLTQLEREQLLSEPVLVEQRPLIFRLFGGAGLAAAASVLLMLGLVVAIYHVLPGRAPVAIVSPSPEEVVSPKPPVEYEKVADDSAMMRKNALDSRVAPPAPVAMKAMAKDALDLGMLHDAEKPALTPSAQNVEQVTLAVTATDVDQANGQVLRFLTDNDIAWSVGAESEVQNVRNFNYPRVVALSESARIEQYSRAIAEEQQAPTPADPARRGGAFAGGAGGGGGRGFGGSVANGPGASKAPAPAEDVTAGVATAGAMGRDGSRELRSLGSRLGPEGATDAKSQQNENSDTLARGGQLDRYRNSLAEANSRTILARGLKASQIEQLAMVLDRPVQGQATGLLQETSDPASALAARARLERNGVALADRMDEAKRAIDEPAKASIYKLKGVSTLDGLRAKQELSESLPPRPLAKPSAAKPDAPTTQLAALAPAETHSGPAQPLYQRPAQAADKSAATAADQPSTRPVEDDLYDVLIVLSPAPVVPPAVNAPPAAAASPVPAAAPASQPIREMKKE